MTAHQDIQNKRIALVSTVGIFATLFVLMFFIILWSPGNPPAFDGGGMELNFGMDDAGFGDVQPTTPVGDNATDEDAAAKSEEQSAPEQEPTPPQNTPDQTVKTQEDPIEDVKSQEESPVTVVPKKDPPKEQVKPVKEVPKTEAPAVKKEEVKANPTTVYNPNSKEATTKASTGEGKKGEAGNHGDKEGAKGDQGNPQGSLDKDALYGNPGKGNPNGPGGEGFGLNMAGWTWDSDPKKPELTDNESGFVVFEITIDAQGEITKTRILENTLSADAVRRCEAKIRERSFVRTAGGAIPPESKGRVRFNLVVR
jgi:periplasmic protein TonB